MPTHQCKPLTARAGTASFSEPGAQAPPWPVTALSHMTTHSHIQAPERGKGR